MFDPEDIDLLKPEDGEAVDSCKLHNWSYYTWVICAERNVHQRWEIKRKRSMRGIVPNAPPSQEELVLLASWAELSNARNPTSCMACNWMARASSSPDEESDKELVEDSAGEENSPFLLAL